MHGLARRFDIELRGGRRERADIGQAGLAPHQGRNRDAEENGEPAPLRDWRGVQTARVGLRNCAAFPRQLLHNRRRGQHPEQRSHECRSALQRDGRK